MGLFRKKEKKGLAAHETAGLFLFDTVNAALAAERVLRDKDYGIALVSPPQNLRTGCDLAVAVSSFDFIGASRELENAGVIVRDWVDDAGEMPSLAELVTSVDFGQWLMVRAGNMKTVVDKETRIIVNTSGGGCPDIPYLNSELVGCQIDYATSPKELGYTLCGLMLERAFVEAKALL